VRIGRLSHPAIVTRFMERAFAVLTPLAIDPAHPFPFVPNMGLVMALDLRREQDGHRMHALLPPPAQVERFIRLPARGADGQIRFLMLDDLIRLSSIGSFRRSGPWLLLLTSPGLPDNASHNALYKRDETWLALL
jgi:polyphosphate kinase